ncbi:biogenesis of lysosome-related organelles complex 1 subunit 5 isoform X4 [Callithrix jacchus]|uniref:biogenesis of lysosome-related organelles complex 1 subunit 5 isoform X5 n=2 Tax=Callithrix jacchus TaxID=9483 RepID=UPI0004F01093|nr:biogenesis of lysosome-related organelles complex 1 subunit 5 isoform X5 [Callithrix jacchus]
MSGGATETPVGCEAAPGGGSKKRDSLGTASSAHLIIKDLGEIHSRLLDHRPVIQGETRYFVKEFECEQLMSQSTNSSRGNRNEKRLDRFINHLLVPGLKSALADTKACWNFLNSLSVDEKKKYFQKYPTCEKGGEP